jgi:3'(2'), 5'-bisphosphate nucleotidase
VGVVYAPAHGWLFAGDVGEGLAWRSDTDGTRETGDRRPIQARPPPAEGLVVLDSRSHRSPATEAYLELLSVRERVAQTRQIGSSLKFCLIAAGEADLYARFGPTMEWDTAAGQAVLQAAGGSVGTPEGLPLRYAKPGFRNGEFIARGLPRNK